MFLQRLVLSKVKYSSNMTIRGALIVLEGLDRSGKSTQCKLLVESLIKCGLPAKLMRFPERSTAIGTVVNKYLNKEIELHDKAAHLLFSANRWELEPSIRASLSSGVSIVLDRYSYSGVAYSSAKNDMSAEFCASPEEGLPRPDVVYFIDVGAEEQKKRGSFGKERYEKTEFQKKVNARFERYQMLENWKVIDGGRDIESIHEELLANAKELCKKVGPKPIEVFKEGELCG